MVAPKVLILGGTGATGLVTLEKALAAGFEVTAYARTPSKFPSSVSSQPNLKVRA
jgi:putative NADH-flavin reductase